MITKLLKRRDLHLDRTYAAPIERVWQAWTEADQLRQWWGPEKTTVPQCEIDLRIGGRIHVVMEATEEMGKYAGTRWPMEGTFTVIDEHRRLSYDAQSWTEGEDGTTITHVNEITFTATSDGTTVELDVAISDIGPNAKMAAFGMKWGYKAQLDKLEAHLA